MKANSKFSQIKLSYTSDNEVVTRSIPDDTFNSMIENFMLDKKSTTYQAIVNCAWNLAQFYSDDDFQSLVFECKDDMGFKIKIEH